MNLINDLVNSILIIQINHSLYSTLNTLDAFAKTYEIKYYLIDHNSESELSNDHKLDAKHQANARLFIKLILIQNMILPR